MLGLEVLGRLIDVLLVLLEACIPNGELSASSFSSRMKPRPGRFLSGLTEERWTWSSAHGRIGDSS